MAPGAAALKTGLRLAARLPLRASRGGLILAVYAAVLVCASLALPWWRMECRAPQYGQRVLVLGVSPTGVEGDARELDILGHYVGMRNLETFAPIERAVAPFAILLTALIALALPFLRPGWPRRFAMAAVIAVPFGFALDLFVWQQYAVTHLDPNAALNMISNRVQARIIGEYRVAQFRVNASFDAGFWLALVAGANVIGFWLAERRGRPSSGGGVSVSVPAPVAAAVALVVALGSFSGSATAATLEVGPHGAYRTVGAAIAAAAPGDEVVVKSGTYRERVRIDRPVVLRGEGAAIVDAGGRGTVITVQAGGTTVRGLTLRGSGTSLVGEDAGIRVVDAPGCTVAENRIEDVLFGVLVIGSAGTRIDDNHVTGKPLPIPRRGDGIRLFDSSHSTVSGNLVEDCRDLSVWESNDVAARHNVVRRGRYGLHYMYCDDNLFEDNVFEDNQVGGAIMYSRRLTLRRNRFVRSRGPSAHGLLIKVADDLLVENNWFVDNTRGIFVEESPSSLLASCTMRRNVVGGNDVGVSMQPSTDRIVFSENAFVANRVQVEVRGSFAGARNQWSAGGRGNYWSDYVGFDADRDGVGDSPYRVEQFLESLSDRWPEVGLLRMGPAAEALELGARAFPIMQPRATAADPHPLIEPPAALVLPAGSNRQPAQAVAGAFVAAAALSLLVRVRRDPWRSA